MKNLTIAEKVSFTFLALVFALSTLILVSACSTLPVTLSAEGICLSTPDGKYAVCLDPVSEQWTVKSTSGGFTSALSYSPATRDWRGTLPDGSALVYAAGKVRVEAALPSAK